MRYRERRGRASTSLGQISNNDRVPRRLTSVFRLLFGSVRLTSSFGCSFGNRWMIFGETSLDHALGAILAHTVQAGSLKFRKGHLLSQQDIEDLRAAGMVRVTAARLEDGDLAENEAASKISQALQFSGAYAGPASMGRVNFYADGPGLFIVNADLINAVNSVDSSVTIATVKPLQRVKKGQMIATVKIIPLAITKAVMGTVADLGAAGTAFHVQSFTGARVGLIQTILPSLKIPVMDKTRRMTEDRILANRGLLTAELRTSHLERPLSEAIRKLHESNDIILIFGASAVADENDILPAAIIAAGGTVHHIGMPVDPGNLLVLAELGGKPVIGAPGCARSPKENGFDWVLNRLMAGLPVVRHDIVTMGVGGLLMEIPARPQLRDPLPEKAPAQVAIAMLAAGQSTRMMGANKLLATFDGVPLIRRSAIAAIEADGSPVIAVLGHMADQCRNALKGLDVVIAHNADYASGLASSLQCAIRHVPSMAEGALIMLADMPALSAEHLQQLVREFQNAGGQSVVRATFAGKRGNPAILPRVLFDEVFTLTGDVGARHLIEREDVPIIDVELGEAAVLDVDTREGLHATGGILPTL